MSHNLNSDMLYVRLIVPTLASRKMSQAAFVRTDKFYNRKIQNVSYFEEIIKTKVKIYCLKLKSTST